MYRNKKIALLIPCFNEEDGIRNTLQGVPEIFDKVFVVDNASTDKTASVAAALGATVLFEPKKGYSTAYMKGFNTIRQEYPDIDIIITADGDGTYGLDNAEKLIDCLMDQNVGLVTGCRFPLLNHDSMKQTNYIGNMVISFLMGFLFGYKVTDSLSGMWCIRVDTLGKMTLKSKAWGICPELKIEAIINKDIGLKEVAISYLPRFGEVKQPPFKVGTQHILFILYRSIRHRFEKLLCRG